MRLAMFWTNVVDITPILKKTFVRNTNTTTKYEKVRFWSDNWCKLGNIRNYLNNESLGIPPLAKLSDLYVNGFWLLPPARSEKQVTIHIKLAGLQLSEEVDYWEWEINGKKSLSYSTREVYMILKDHKPLVSWHKEIWFSGGIPKHRLLTWLFTLNRCPTRDRMISWGLPVNPMCLLCNNHHESRDHLFFLCTFTGPIWRRITDRLLIQSSQDWNQTLHILRTLRGNKILKTLALLGWQSTIYFTWQERNHRLHRNKFSTDDALFKVIDLTIRNRASSFREENPRKASLLLQKWLQD